MLDKHDSFNGSLLSYQSDSQNIVKILFEKIPDVEEILTNSIKILEDENYERSDSKQDLISAFIEILEIYELTKILISSYHRKDDRLNKVNEKMRDLKYKYHDLKSNFQSIIEENVNKDQQIQSFDEVIREFENENYELKTKIMELNQIINLNKKEMSNFLLKLTNIENKKLPQLINNNKEKISQITIFEYEEQIKSLNLENLELNTKCRNLHDILKSKEEKIGQLQNENEMYVHKVHEDNNQLENLKRHSKNLKQELHLKRFSTFQIESSIKYDIVPNNFKIISRNLSKKNKHSIDSDVFSYQEDDSIIYNRRNSKLCILQKESSRQDSPNKNETPIYEATLESDTPKLMYKDVNISRIEIDNKEEEKSNNIVIVEANNIPVENTLAYLLTNEIDHNNKSISEIEIKQTSLPKNLNPNYITITPNSSINQLSISKKDFKNKVSRIINKKLTNIQKTKKAMRNTNLLINYRKKIRRLILLTKKQKRLLNNNEGIKDFLTPRYCQRNLSHHDLIEKLQIKNHSNRHTTIDKNPKLIDFESIVTSACNKFKMISNSIEKLSVKNYINIFEANRSVIEAKSIKKNTNHNYTLAKLYINYQNKLILQTSFTINRSNLKYEITSPNQVSLNTFFSIKKVNNNNLIFEYFSFSLEKTFDKPQEKLKIIRRNNKKISYKGKNIDVNVNVTLELKDQFNENSLVIPISNNGTLETRVGSTKFNNNNTIQTLENQNNYIPNSHLSLFQNKEKLKEFYKKYLKYSDYFMKESLQTKTKPFEEIYKKIPKNWNNLYKYENIDNLLFLRKNKFKLKKF